jgi:hypothetical protein
MIGASSDPFIAADEIIKRIPDILITDLFLPLKGPSSFLRLFYEKLGVHMPAIIVCSGCITPTMLEANSDCGIYRCFQKPVCCNMLVSAVKDAFLALEDKKYGFELTSMVNSVLMRMGSPTEQKGHLFLRDSITLYAKAAKKRQASVMDIYKELAKKHSTTPECVERLCRNTLETIWEKGDSNVFIRELFSERVK